MVMLIAIISLLGPKYNETLRINTEQWKMGTLIRSCNKTCQPEEERNGGWIWQPCQASGEIRMWMTGNVSQVHRTHREGLVPAIFGRAS